MDVSLSDDVGGSSAASRLQSTVGDTLEAKTGNKVGGGLLGIAYIPLDVMEGSDIIASIAPLVDGVGSDGWLADGALRRNDGLGRDRSHSCNLLCSCRGGGKGQVQLVGEDRSLTCQRTHQYIFMCQPLPVSLSQHRSKHKRREKTTEGLAL